MPVVGWVKGSQNYYPISQIGEEQPTCPCKGFHWRQSCRHTKDFLEGKFNVEMKFKVSFIDDFGVPVEIEGLQRFNPDHLTVEDVTENISKTEHFLSQLTGYNVKIEQIL